MPNPALAIQVLNLVERFFDGDKTGPKAPFTTTKANIVQSELSATSVEVIGSRPTEPRHI
jgi:hypothetical protein